MAAINDALATIEIDELVPTAIDGTVLFCKTIRVGPIELAIEPEWEIELA